MSAAPPSSVSPLRPPLPRPHVIRRLGDTTSPPQGRPPSPCAGTPAAPSARPGGCLQQPLPRPRAQPSLNARCSPTPSGTGRSVSPEGPRLQLPSLRAAGREPLPGVWPGPHHRPRSLLHTRLQLRRWAPGSRPPSGLRGPWAGRGERRCFQAAMLARGGVGALRACARACPLSPAALEVQGGSADQMTPLFKAGEPACLPGGRQPPVHKGPSWALACGSLFRNEGIQDRISEPL